MGNIQKPILSIVLPCLNEEETVGQCVQEATSALAGSGLDGEVLVVDNGSTDRSVELAVAAGARVEVCTQRGYGAALRHGSLAANGQWIIMADADLSYNLNDINGMLEALQQGADVVIGDRFGGDIQQGAMPWANRVVGNPILSAIGRIFSGTSIRDFHCGIRAVTADAFRRMDTRTDGMEFATEMIFRASELRLVIASTPVQLRPDGRNRKPHLRPVRDAIRHVIYMVLFSRRWLLAYPALFMALLAALLVFILPLILMNQTSISSKALLLFPAIAVVLVGAAQFLAFGAVVRVIGFNEELFMSTAVGRFAQRKLALVSTLVVGIILVCVSTFGVVGLAVSDTRVTRGVASGIDQMILATAYVAFGSVGVTAVCCSLTLIFVKLLYSSRRKSL